MLRARGCELSAAALDRQAAAHATGAHRAGRARVDRAFTEQPLLPPPPPPPQHAQPPPLPPPPTAASAIKAQPCACTGPASPGPSYGVAALLRCAEAGALAGRQWTVCQGIKLLQFTAVRAARARVGVQRTLEGVSKARQTVKEAGFDTALWSRTAVVLQGLETGLQGATQQTLAVAQNVSRRIDLARVVKAFHRACLGELFL